MILTFGEDKGWAAETWRSEEFERAGRRMNKGGGNGKGGVPFWVWFLIALGVTYAFFG